MSYRIIHCTKFVDLLFFGIKPKSTYGLCLAMIATFQSWLIWPCIDRGLLRSSKIHQFRSPGPPSSPTDYVLRLGNNAEIRNTKIQNAENICCFENVCCFCISSQSFLRQFRSPWPSSSPTDNHYVLRLGNNADFRFVISKSWFSQNLPLLMKVLFDYYPARCLRAECPFKGSNWQTVPPQ